MDPLPPMVARPVARRRVARSFAIVLAVGGMGLTLCGGALALQQVDPSLYGQGRTFIGLGIVVAAFATTFGLVRRAHDPDAREGSTMRTLALFLQLIASTSLLMVVAATLHRLDIVTLPVALFVRGEPFLVVVLALAQGAAHLAALRQPPVRERGLTSRIVASVCLLATAVVAIVGILAAREDPFVADVATLGPSDAGMVLLASAVLASIALHIGQGMPSVLDILRSSDQAARAGGRARSVVLPVVVAFSLLVLSLLLFVLFGVGVLGALQQVATEPSLMLVFVAILAAVVASLFGALRLVKHEEARVELYRPYSDPRAKRERLTLVVSLGIAGLLVATATAVYAGITPLASSSWLHFAAIGLLIGIGPYGFMVSSEAGRIRRLEERFPDFLREIASSHKGGLTLASAVTVSARGDYGPLTPEIKRMADQVAWNVPFTEALERFAARVQTPLVQRAVNLIVEADRSGGSSTDILLAAARDAREIKTLENERIATMTLYTMIIYITFFVFLGVAAVLYSQFVPALVASSEANAAAGNAVGPVAGFGAEALRADQFQLFYFLAALVQALGDGIVAGMMGTGRAVLGLRHSFLMVLVAYLTFAVFLR